MKKWIASIFAASSLAGGGIVFGADQVQNPYTDRETHYELPIKAEIAQGERVLIDKEKAAITLQGWNGEYHITVKPQIPTGEGSLGATDRDFDVPAGRKLLSKKMEYKQGDVTAFIEPKEGTENEFDIDFTLDSKPETNIFEYKIEGAENFRFLYQPAPTPEEIADGMKRPENVTGSYAVYHNEKKNNCLNCGTPNYGTGKVMHIFRPKAIDANNAETWAELKYEKGVLSVTVPQKFLDDAAYPVRVDPTFGYTSLGGTTFSADSRTQGTQFALTETGKIYSLTIGANTTSSNTDENTQGIGAIYRASDNAKLATTTEFRGINATTTSTFYDFTFKELQTLSADTYWLIFGGATTDADQVGSSFDTDASVVSTRVAFTYPTFIDPLVPGADGDRKYSIYASYCIEGSACGPITVVISDSSSVQTWTAPTGVTSAQVACWGGGGGGFDDGTGSNGGAGGGGGAFASSTVAVTAGNTYNVTVASSSPENLPATGKFSQFVGDDKTVLACGGTGATSATANGVGGTTACSTGDVEAAGGAGGDAVTTDDTGGGGGGGGGPAGTGGAGSNGSATVGGGGGGGNNGGAGGQPTRGTAGPNAGVGGAGGSSTNAEFGRSGAYAGGGGGGGDNGTSGGGGGYPAGGGGGGEANGGEGQRGLCTITYSIAATVFNASPTSRYHRDGAGYIKDGSVYKKN